MGANGLLLHYSSNAEIAGCLEGSNTAKQSSSGKPSRRGGVVPGRQYRGDSLVDLADFAPYVPCGMRNQYLSIIRDSGSSLGWCIRVTRNGFISACPNLGWPELPDISFNCSSEKSKLYLYHLQTLLDLQSKKTMRKPANKS